MVTTNSDASSSKRGNVTKGEHNVGNRYTILLQQQRYQTSVWVKSDQISDIVFDLKLIL